MLWAIALLLLLSGAASLTYQVAWVRLLGLSMGVTSAAVSTVVAAFFMGLSLGSFLVARLAPRLRDGLKVYWMLEAAIGVSGLALLPVLLNLDRVMALSPALGGSLLSKFLVASALLLIPTLCMGATFPVMARVLVRSEAELGMRLSDLYAFNTLGAVLGAALSGFVFIPRLGLDGAVLVAALLNLSAVLITLFVRRWPYPPALVPTSAVADSASRSRLSTRQYKVLVVLCATGFVAIAVEVAWTKYLVMFVGTTIYGFSAVLAAVLLGVALGSWSVRRRIDAWPRPEKQLVMGLCLLGVCLLLTRSGLGHIVWVNQYLEQTKASEQLQHLARYLVVFVLLLPANWLFGALFPIGLRLFCSGTKELGRRVGLAYAVNTLAGIAGALVAGFLWLPTVGTAHLLLWTAILVLFLPFLFWADVGGRAALLVPGSLVASVAIYTVFPGPSYEKLIAAVRLDKRYSKAGWRTVFLKEGRTGVVSVGTSDGRDYRLYNNGLNESRLFHGEPHNGLLMESLLALIPYMLHQKPRSAFVVGLGGGATMRALEFSAIESIRVVELEPRMRDALLSVYSPEQAGLSDPRLRLSFGDARNTLLVEPRRYDIIVSQPSHPWRAGAANLFTEQFFEIAKQRLEPGGIHGQWLAMFRMDATTLRAIMQAFVSVFPEALAIVGPERSDILFFGSERPLEFQQARLLERAQEPGIRRLLLTKGVRDPVQLLRLFALSRAEMVRAAGDITPSTDLNLLPEVRLATLLKNPRGEQSPWSVVRSGRFDVLPYIEDPVQSQWLQQLAHGLNSAEDGARARQALRQLSTIDPDAERRLRALLKH